MAELADLLRIDGVYPFGPEAFDVYAGRRTTPMLPAYVPEIERPIPLAQGGEVFVYLQGQVQDRPEIMAALRAIDRPARIYITNLSPAERAKFPASAAIERQAVPPAEILRRSRCVVHHGGPQLTAICLAAGLPQVILARELDNETSGRFVHARGLGAAEHMVRATTEWLLHWVRRTHDDAALKQRCEAAAPEFAAWFAADPTRIVADAALRLVGR
jgi:UDP:flavonoid glycosyltransferase YjiC (YdhE family)